MPGGACGCSSSSSFFSTSSSPLSLQARLGRPLGVGEALLSRLLGRCPWRPRYQRRSAPRWQLCPWGPAGRREVPNEALGTFPAGVLASRARVYLRESVGIRGFLGPCVYMSPLARGARFRRSLTSVQQSWCFGRAGTSRLPSDRALCFSTFL